MNSGGQLRAIGKEISEPLSNLRELRKYLSLKSGRRTERQKTHHRTNFEVVRGSVRQAKHIIEETILLVPHPRVVAEVHHRRSDPEKVFDELQPHVGIAGVRHRQLPGDL